LIFKRIVKCIDYFYFMHGSGNSIIHHIHLNDYSANPKYVQVADSIKQAVQDGHLKINDTLPSINELSFDLAVSRDTIEKSYRKLKSDGILGSVPGKGFFIKSTEIEKQLKVFLLFNKLSEHKKIIYDSFAATLGDKASIDFYIYNNDFSIFKKLLTRHIGSYSHYVIIPHFIEGHDNMRNMLSNKPLYIRWSVYYVILISVLLLCAPSSQRFIYFQF